MFYYSWMHSKSYSPFDMLSHSILFLCDNLYNYYSYYFYHFKYMLNCVLQETTIFVSLNFYDHFYDCFSFFIFILELVCFFFFCLVSSFLDKSECYFDFFIDTLYFVFQPQTNQVFFLVLWNVHLFFL